MRFCGADCPDCGGDLKIADGKHTLLFVCDECGERFSGFRDEDNSLIVEAYA